MSYKKTDNSTKSRKLYMNKMRSLTDREKSQKVIKQKIVELKNTMNEIKTFYRKKSILQ